MDESSIIKRNLLKLLKSNPVVCPTSKTCTCTCDKTVNEVQVKIVALVEERFSFGAFSIMIRLLMVLRKFPFSAFTPILGFLDDGDLVFPVLPCFVPSEYPDICVMTVIEFFMDVMHWLECNCEEAIPHFSFMLENLTVTTDGKLSMLPLFQSSEVVIDGSRNQLYQAPETLGVVKFDPLPSLVWQLGVTLCYMLYGCHPIEGVDTAWKMFLHLSVIAKPTNTPSLPDIDRISEKQKKMILLMVSRDPSKRPTLSDLREFIA